VATSIGSVTIGQALGTAKSVTLEARKLYEYYGAPNPDGVTEASLEIQFPRNTLVLKYEVVMGAATAHAVTAGQAGQVRTTPGNGTVSVVVDFGSPRTVSAVGAPEGVLIQSISTWIGTEFAKPLKYDTTKGTLGENFVMLTSEVRTERLLVVVGGSPSTDELANNMVLVVPEAPSGIEVRIDGAAPVFSQLPAVDPRSLTELSQNSWNTASQRLVDLAPALALLLGDPLDESTVVMRVTLTSRVPGVLSLVPLAGGAITRRIRRALFNGQSSRDVAFTAEGRQTVEMSSIPPNLTVLETRLTLLGKPPVERIVPPIGPETRTPPFASFTLTPNRAACIRLPGEPRIGEFSGVRIPLAAGDSGAEARVLLWRSKDLANQSPSESLPVAASDPVTLEAGSDDWRTFRWKQPLPAPADYVLWAALIVNRGEAVMTLADSTSAGAAILLWGAPTGPWHDLPGALRPAAPEPAARGRIRLIGNPRAGTAFPPLAIDFPGGVTVAATPHPKGVLVSITTSAPIVVQPGLLSLGFTSYSAGQVTLRDVDVISTT